MSSSGGKGKDITRVESTGTGESSRSIAQIDEAQHGAPDNSRLIVHSQAR